jgi:hypothetical protein
VGIAWAGCDDHPVLAQKRDESHSFVKKYSSKMNAYKTCYAINSQEFRLDCTGWLYSSLVDEDKS